MEIRVIGIDLGKSVFHLVGMDKYGKVVVRKRLLRSQMMVYTAMYSILCGTDKNLCRKCWISELNAPNHYRSHEEDYSAIPISQ